MWLINILMSMGSVSGCYSITMTLLHCFGFKHITGYKKGNGLWRQADLGSNCIQMLSDSRVSRVRCATYWVPMNFFFPICKILSHRIIVKLNLRILPKVCVPWMLLLFLPLPFFMILISFVSFNSLKYLIVYNHFLYLPHKNFKSLNVSFIRTWPLSQW